MNNLINQSNQLEHTKYKAYQVLSFLTLRKFPELEKKKKEAMEDWLEGKDQTRL